MNIREGGREVKIRHTYVPCSCLLRILSVLEELYSWATQVRFLIQINLKAEKIGWWWERSHLNEIQAQSTPFCISSLSGKGEFPSLTCMPCSWPFEQTCWGKPLSIHTDWWALSGFQEKLPAALRGLAKANSPCFYPSSGNLIFRSAWQVSFLCDQWHNLMRL